MPKLIIINGACGVGKSTIANAIHESIPLSIKIEVDELMRWMTGYRLPENRDRKRATANAMAIALLEASLQEGHDVIIEKMQFDQHVLDAQIEIAKKYNVNVTEVILWAPKDIVMQRAHDRGWIEGGSLTPEKCEIFWDRIDEMKNERPSATIIDTMNKSVEEVIDEVKAVIA